MEAVDFPKTGVPPKSLETKWGDDLDDDDNDDLENDENPSRDKPPERPERCPDFMEKNNEPMYIRCRHLFFYSSLLRF